MKLLLVLIKILVSVLLAWLVLRHIDLKAAFSLIEVHPGVMAAAVVIFLLQVLLAGFRLPPILSVYGARVSVIESVRLWLIGLFTSQTMVTFIAGDAVRVWLLARPRDNKESEGQITLRVAAKAIVFDRLFGLAVLLLLSALSAAVLLLNWPMKADMRGGLLLLLGVCAAALAGFAVSPSILKMKRFLPEKLRHDKRVEALLDVMSVAEAGFCAWRQTLMVGALGVLMHFTNALALYTILRGFGETLTLPDAAVVAFPATLISVMPISFAGWGVREGAMVAGLGLFAIDSSTAVAASVTFGLAQLISSLPGGALLIARPWKKVTET